MANERSIPGTSTAVASAPSGRTRREAHPVLVVVATLILAALLGWIIAGLPGVRAPNTFSVVLILLSIASGALTLVFVVRALRRARSSERGAKGEGTAVLISSGITALVSIAQMIEVLQQILR